MKSIPVSLGLLIPAMRISFALTLLTSCMLFGAEFLGFTPKEEKFLLDARKKISESLAIQFSLLDPVNDVKELQELTSYIVKLSPEIVSAGIRQQSGELTFQSPNHEEIWRESDGQYASSTQVIVPIKKNNVLWGAIEFQFDPFKNYSLLNFFEKSIFKTFIFFIVIGFFTYLIFILRILRELDPSSVVPDRVNTAFDTLSEGVIIIDKNEHILLSNRAFSTIMGQDQATLIGKKISELPWEKLLTKKSDIEFPWSKVLSDNEDCTGTQLILNTPSGKKVRLVVNASAINAQSDKVDGVMITLDDITLLERRNSKLQAIVQKLKKTQIQVKQQNKELSYLATHDPLTGCLNRRSFSEKFDIQFDSARKFNTELSCIMVDLDKFKLVNDNYGHAIGDEVIKLLASVLKACTRDEDVVGRYGGEEFCILLLGMSAEKAMIVAERIRSQVKIESAKRFENGPHVAASLGVADMLDNPESVADLNNKADEALYAAKESGRDQVVRWRLDLTNDSKVSS